MNNEGSSAGIDGGQMLYAKDIPLVRREYNSAYDASRSKIGIEDFPTPDQVMILGYFLFGTYIEDYNESGGHVFRKLELQMPEEIRAICKVFEHKGKDFKAHDAISLVVRPDALKKFVDFFSDDFIDAQSSLNSTEKSAAKFYMRMMREKLGEQQNNDSENQAYIDEARNISGKAWENYSREMKKSGEKVMEGEKKRTRTHEQTHYVTTKHKWRGVIGKIYDSGVFVFSDFKKAEFGENDEELRRMMNVLARTHDLLHAAMEAEAFIHECLSSNTIGPGMEYSHYAWSRRLLSLLKKFEEIKIINREKVVGKKKLKIDYVLNGELVPREVGASDYLEHDAGALLIIFANEDNIEQLVANQDFSSLGENDAMRSAILEKVADLLSDEVESESLLKAKYDLIQTLLAKLTASFVGQYMQFVQNPAVLAALNDEDRARHRQFIDFCKENEGMFEDEVNILRPIEIKRERRGLMKRLFSRYFIQKRKAI